MNPERHFNDRVWEDLFAFAFPDPEDQSLEEVQAELRHQGIDVRPAVQDVLRAVAARKKATRAREALDSARRKREGLADRLGEVVLDVSAAGKKQLMEMIANVFSGETRTALFRKLDRAASEADMRSLLEDLARLEMLEEGDDEDSP